MKLDYTLAREAQKDFENSLRWYNERSINAGEGFIEDFEQTIATICETPLRWANTVAHYHEVSMKRYPFRIVYFIDEEVPVIVVVRIYHHSRNPDEKYLTNSLSLLTTH